MKILDYLIGCLGILAVFLLFIGYLGALHPFFDSIAVMRLHILISLGMAVLYMMLRRRWRGAVGLGVINLIGVGAMLPYMVNVSDAGPITMMQANLLFRNDAAAQVVYITDTHPDIVTLQEITDLSLSNLLGLADYPTQKICKFAAVGGVMVLSRFPEIPDMSGCVERQGMAWVRVMTPDGPVTLVSIHLFWPWPHGQSAQIDALVPVLNDLPRPVIIGGDFNMVPWGHNVHRIETASGTKALRGIRFTFDIYQGWGRLPIDQILAPDGFGTAIKGPRLGSDHNSVIAKVGLR